MEKLYLPLPSVPRLRWFKIGDITVYNTAFDARFARKPYSMAAMLAAHPERMAELMERNRAEREKHNKR